MLFFFFVYSFVCLCFVFIFSVNVLLVSCDHCIVVSSACRVAPHIILELNEINNKSKINQESKG